MTDVREFVHPTVYALRAACPLWTNRPNAAHRHLVMCAGFNEGATSVTDIENEPELPDNDPVPTPNPDPDEAAAVDPVRPSPLGAPEESR